MRSVAFSPDGKIIASCNGNLDYNDRRFMASSSGDFTVRLWDASSGAHVGEPLKGHNSKVLFVAFSPDGRIIASGSKDKTVRLWDASSGAQVGEPLKGHSESVFWQRRCIFENA